MHITGTLHTSQDVLLAVGILSSIPRREGRKDPRTGLEADREFLRQTGKRGNNKEYQILAYVFG
jgi:hypothetical protein